MLLGAGADIEAHFTIGHNATPLHIAAGNGSCDALVTLLRHKADVHAQNNTGRSSRLMLACAFVYEKAAKLLLRWGADETSLNSSGRSAEQLVGVNLNQGDRRGRAEDMECLRRLLARAPADRSWRRRGLLIICHFFPDKARPGSVSNQVVDDGIERTAREGRTRVQENVSHGCDIYG